MTTNVAAYQAVASDFNFGLEKLGKDMGDAATAVSRVETTAQTLASETGRLSANGRTQSDALGETAGALGDIVSRLRESASQSRQAEKSVAGTRQSVEQSGEIAISQ